MSARDSDTTTNLAESAYLMIQTLNCGGLADSHDRHLKFTLLYEEATKVAPAFYSIISLPAYDYYINRQTVGKLIRNS